MNHQTDVSATLASLLSILSQSSQKPHRQQPVPPRLPINQPLPANIEPVFIDSDSIFDTSQWIGVPTTSWREPQQWHLPSRKSVNPPPPPPAVNTEDSPPAVVAPPTSYSCALKLVIQKAQSNDFLLELQRIKRRQHEVEEDLFEARCRIQRKYESKRKMNQLLKNLGSQDVSEKTLLKEEEEELISFDKDVAMKWEELIVVQKRQIEALGIPYFGVVEDHETLNHQRRILDFLEDLIPGQGDE